MNAESLANFKILKDIQPHFIAFILANERIAAPKFLCEIPYGETFCPPFLFQEGG